MEQKEQVTHDVLLSNYNAALESYERAKTRAQLAKHAAKTAEGSKTDIEIARLVYEKAKSKRKKRKLDVKIAKLLLRASMRAIGGLDKKFELVENVEVATEAPKKRGPKPKGANAENTAGEKTKKPGRPRVKATEEPEVETVVETVVEVAEEVVAEGKTRRPRRSSEELKAELEEKEAQAKADLSRGDDFRIIEGIGLKAAVMLHDNGVLTFADLAATPAENIKPWLGKMRMNVVNPASWAQQAQLVVENKHEELRELQTQLKAGRFA